MRVDIDHVRFAYPGSRPALDDVKLTVESSSIHAVVGPNGCGKSTLLRLIAGMESPTAGEVRITGERRHTNETAIVFQDPRLLGWWNVGRNIGIGPEFGDVEPSMYERLRDFFASHVGLGHLVDRLPGTLSRGQQSRAGLGRALAHDADVVLLDAQVFAPLILQAFENARSGGANPLLAAPTKGNVVSDANAAIPIVWTDSNDDPQTAVVVRPHPWAARCALT